MNEMYLIIDEDEDCCEEDEEDNCCDINEHFIMSNVNNNPDIPFQHDSQDSNRTCGPAAIAK